VKTEEADLCDHRRVLTERTRRADLDWVKTVLSVITILLVNLGQQRELFDPTSSSTSADYSRHQRFGWKQKGRQKSTNSQFTAVR